MSFENEVENVQKEVETSGDFYKFKEGDNWMRLMAEPKIKVSRWGFGICYEGAPYCSKEALEADYKKAQEKAKADGKDPKDVNPPNLSKKWMVWAMIRSEDGKSDYLSIVDLPYGVSKKLKEIKEGKDSSFDAWPMPYDVNITVKGAGKKSVEYDLLVARKDVPVTEDELKDLEKVTPVEQILDKMKSKQKEKIDGGKSDGAPEATGVEYPEEEINAGDIPF